MSVQRIRLSFISSCFFQICWKIPRHHRLPKGLQRRAAVLRERVRLHQPPPVLHEDGGSGEAEEGVHGRPLVSGPRGGVGAGGGGGGGQTQRAAVRYQIFTGCLMGSGSTQSSAGAWGGKGEQKYRSKNVFRNNASLCLHVIPWWAPPSAAGSCGFSSLTPAGSFGFTSEWSSSLKLVFVQILQVYQKLLSSLLIFDDEIKRLEKRNKTGKFAGCPLNDWRYVQWCWADSQISVFSGSGPVNQLLVGVLVAQ